MTELGGTVRLGLGRAFLAIVQKMKEAVIGTKGDHGNELGVSLGWSDRVQGYFRGVLRGTP